MTRHEVTESTSTPLFWLDPPLPMTYREKLWGTLVASPYAPTRFDYASSTSGFNPEVLCKALVQDPQEVIDYQQCVDRSTSADLSLKIARAFQVSANAESTATDSRSARRGLWWYMDLPPRRLEQLSQNNTWNNDAKVSFSRVGKGEPLYFVTCILALADMVRTREQRQGVTAEGGLTVPDQHGQALVEAAIKGGKTVIETNDGTLVGDNIVAIGVWEAHQVIMEKNPKKKKGDWLKNVFHKPKDKGTLVPVTAYPISDTHLAQIRLGLDMVPGNTNLLGPGDEEGEKVEDADADASATNKEVIAEPRQLGREFRIYQASPAASSASA